MNSIQSMNNLSFFDLWRKYMHARCESSAHYKQYSDELNSRIAQTMTRLNCDKRTAIEDLMKK